MMTQAQLHITTQGAILFDSSLAMRVEEPWFDADYWQAQNCVVGHAGGRGQVVFIDGPFAAGVLRHYQRGGVMARLIHDRYLWTGMERNRAFREFRLLAQMHSWGLPVPAPIAARYRRIGCWYQADLITGRLENVVTLAEHVCAKTFDASLATRVGACVAEFHAKGVCHADLNAHNVLVDATRIWLVDFDRGTLRSPIASWPLSNLARLKRSLLKLGAGKPSERTFEHEWWRPFMLAYQVGRSNLLRAPRELPRSSSETIRE